VAGRPAEPTLRPGVAVGSDTLLEAKTMKDAVKVFGGIAKFLEEYPLYKQFKLGTPSEAKVSVTSMLGGSSGPARPVSLVTGEPKLIGAFTVHMWCDLCRSSQTFTLVVERDEPAATRTLELDRDGVSLLVFRCAGCQETRRRFLVEFNHQQRWLRKVGQHPPWEPRLDQREAEAELVGDYGTLYKRGLACEREGYGIGASAYYRRVVEGVIDQLLESIKGLLDASQQEEYGEALAKLQQDTVAARKIECVKDYLPSSLRPGGINPLDILHGHLSTDLHTRSDEDCLADASDIRQALLHLLGEVKAEKGKAKAFREATGRLLKKRSKGAD